jgi:hypothetical protein
VTIENTNGMSVCAEKHNKPDELAEWCGNTYSRISIRCFPCSLCFHPKRYVQS